MRHFYILIGCFLLLFTTPAIAGPGPVLNGATGNGDALNAIGIRFGTTTGFTYTRALEIDRSLELIMSFRRNGLQITGVYQWEHPFLERYMSSVFWYAGAGGHMGYYNYSVRDRVNVYDPLPGPPPPQFEPYVYHTTSLAMGVDGQIGAVWKPANIPFQVALEFKPYLDILDWYRPLQFYTDMGLVFRYAF